MRTPVARDRSAELLARFEKLLDDAAESVPQPPTIGVFYDDPAAFFRDFRDDDPKWKREAASQYFERGARVRAAMAAAVEGQFSRAELESLLLGRKNATTPHDRRRFAAISGYAKRALKVLAVRARHSYLLQRKAEGTLPSRVCPCCTATLGEDSWDPTVDESGFCNFIQPVTCRLPQCESAFTRDDGTGTLGIAWGSCCLWCQRWFRTDAADPGDRPPDEGQPDHDPAKTATWEHAVAEYHIFKSFCLPTCYAIGIGGNVFVSDEMAASWEPGTVSRDWTGSPWPRTYYLARPPVTLSERHKAGAGQWPRSVLVAWTGSEPEIAGGKPHPWMLREPQFKPAIEQYARELQEQRALRAATVTPLAIGEGQRALPPAEEIIDAVTTRTSAFDTYVAHLRTCGPSTDHEVGERTGLNPATIKWARQTHKGRFAGDGGRPARWRVAE